MGRGSLHQSHSEERRKQNLLYFNQFDFNLFLLRSIGVPCLLSPLHLVGVLGCAFSHTQHTIEQMEAIQRVRLGHGKETRVMHSGPSPGLRGRQVGGGRGLSPAHSKVRMHYVT